MAFVIAHRAGNDVGRLRSAEALELQLAEADLHLFRGRVEVRHLKTLGPVPILWDSWKLASPRTPRLLLGELLAAAGPDTELMLDLKGRDARLSRKVRDAITAAGIRRVTVCSRNWRLLDPLRDLPQVRIVHSVGSRCQLRALRRRFQGLRLTGISIHRDLLDAEQVRDLRERAELIMAWPVETSGAARELSAWGVDGLISRNFESVAEAIA